ncbi:MAG: hypothetical protein IT425_06315 [Pirellulales bacterium]|nr:hypothetical protein [Pirellulales bacterium]
MAITSIYAFFCGEASASRHLARYGGVGEGLGPKLRLPTRRYHRYDPVASINPRGRTTLVAGRCETVLPMKAGCRMAGRHRRKAMVMRREAMVKPPSSAGG